MPGEGVMAYAKQVTERNRALLKNKRKWHKPDYAFDFKFKKKLKYKEYKSEYKKELLESLKRENRINTFKSFILFIVSFGVVLTGVYYLFIA